MISIAQLVDRLGSTGKALLVLGALVSGTVTATVAVMVAMSGIWAAPAQAEENSKRIDGIETALYTLKVTTCQTLKEIRGEPWESCLER